MASRAATARKWQSEGPVRPPQVSAMKGKENPIIFSSPMGNDLPSRVAFKAMIGTIMNSI